MLGLFRRARRSPRPLVLPRGWPAIVLRNVPLARNLTADEAAKLEQLAGVFLEDKRFEGCGGLELTDEMRVTIAAHACLLLVGRGGDVFPTVETILVYPHPYKATTRERVGPVTIERPQARAGEAWGARGPLILAWDEVLRASVPSERNVVLHEFAHALDSEDSSFDGAPVLGPSEQYRAWHDVMSEAFEGLTKSVREGRESDLNPYGATNPAEFFAVVTEAFFGAPEKLRENHPALYAELARFYGVRHYAALAPGVARDSAPRREPDGTGTRKINAALLGLFAMGCVAAVASAAIRPRRVGILSGTVTGPPRYVQETSLDTNVSLDTGPVVRVDNTLCAYDPGARVKVEILESRVLHRTSYQFVLPCGGSGAVGEGPAIDVGRSAGPY